MAQGTLCSPKVLLTHPRYSLLTQGTPCSPKVLRTHPSYSVLTQGHAVQMHGAGTAIRKEVRMADHVWETLASGLRMECGIPHQLWAMRGWDSILAEFLTSQQRSYVEAGLLVIDDVSIRTSLKGAMVLDSILKRLAREWSHAGADTT